MAARKKKGLRGVGDGPVALNFEDQEMIALLNSTDPRVLETFKKVEKIFKLFDQGNQKMIDVREAGCVTRALGLYPTEADVQDIIATCEEAGTKGYLKHERFVPFLVKTILDGTEYKAPPKDLVWNAFKYLDRDKLGFLEPGRLKEVLMKQGEPFTEDEADAMLKFTVNQETNKLNWEDYVRAVNYELPDDYLKLEKELKKKRRGGGSGYSK